MSAVPTETPAGPIAKEVEAAIVRTPNSSKPSLPGPRHNFAHISPYLDEDKCNTWPDASAIRGQHVVITGGASGFGKAFALKYVEAGCTVTIGDVDRVKGEQLQKEYSAIRFVYCNVLSWQDQCTLFQTAMSRATRGIDIVIANAGVTEGKFCEELLKEPLQEPNLRTLDINLRAQFYTAKLAHFYFSKSRPLPNGAKKNLILLGSMASVGEIPGGPEYTAAKHGMLGLMRSLRRTSPQEPGNGACRVNSIHPWFVETGIIDVREKLLLAGTIYGKIEDVVKAAMVISCDDSINGRALAILEPSLGVVDIAVEGHPDGRLNLSEVGDFGRFTRRVEFLYSVRAQAMHRATMLKALWQFASKTLKWPALLAILVITFKRSSRLQMLWLVLSQRLHG